MEGGGEEKREGGRKERKIKKGKKKAEHAINLLFINQESKKERRHFL